jgi:tyrosyl-tRNA synthetase
MLALSTPFSAPINFGPRRKNSMNLDHLLTRRIAKVLPSKQGLEKLLQTKKKIRLYQGFDPTGYRLHLGHTIGLRKLMEFANMLFGTGTVLVGDPSERDTARQLITQKEIEQNIKNWQKQVSPIVDFNKITIKQNGDWLIKLTLKDIVKIASNISAVQLFKREFFQRRIKTGSTVWYHETMYPLLQGYDSVVMDVDLEIGGTDQEFNMLIGRELQRKMNNREKFVLTTPMILGTDGRKMSKTSKNCVWLDDSAEDMFGKLMSIPDQQIDSYLELLTDLAPTIIKDMSPMDAKKILAFDITKQFHHESKAQKAQQHFQTTVQQRQVPKDIPEITLSSTTTVIDACMSSGATGSRSESKRLVQQGGFSLNDKKITDPQKPLGHQSGDKIKIGKRHWFKVK